MRTPRSARPARRSTVSRWPWLALAAGLLLVQSAWIILVPPFDGQDEHDHAFKAAAVARGDWSGDHERVVLGRSGLMAVPDDIVEAAMPACEALPYTQRDDCRPSAELAGGQVLVGSSFAPTHPAFYAFVGTAALPFDGAAAGYAMRAAGALLCTALILAAAAVLRRTSRSPWPATALVLVLTPAMMYASSLPAPNGPEMAAGLLLWCTLLFGATDTSVAPRWVVVAGTVAAVVLATVRTIGPLWLGLIVVVAVMYHGTTWARTRLGARALWPAYTVVACSVMGGAAWTLLFSPNDPSNESGSTATDSPWPRLPGAWAVWVMQQIAAMPRRGDMVPATVYAVVLAAWAVLLVLAFQHGHRAVRLPIISIFVLTTLVSVTLTVLTYDQISLAWQGRYAWPFVLGWLLLAAHSLERREVAGGSPALAIAGAVAAVSLVVSVVGVRHTFLASALPGQHTPSAALLMTLTLVGVCLLLAGATRLRSSDARPCPVAGVQPGPAVYSGNTGTTGSTSTSVKLVVKR